MEQTSEEHLKEETVEKNENIEKAANEQTDVNQKEIIVKDEVVIEDDDNSSEENDEESSKIVEEKIEVKSDELSQDTNEESGEAVVKKVEENNNIENVETEEIKTENNSSETSKQQIDAEVEEDNVDDVAEVSQQVNEKSKNVADSVNVEKSEENDQSEIVEVQQESKTTETEIVNNTSQDKVDNNEVNEVENVHISLESSPATNNNVSIVESFEKKIENLKISTEPQSTIQNEREIKQFKEKEIEIRRADKEKENNNLYAENPTNQTSSYLHKIFTPAEDVPTPKNRQSEYIEEEFHENSKPNNFPLKMVMNPKGKVRDVSSLTNEELFTDTGLLSPDKCKELISGLNEPKGKGAELFAKRRKRAEKWAAEDELVDNQKNLYQHAEPTYQKVDQIYVNRGQNELYQKHHESNYKEESRRHFVQNQPDVSFNNDSAQNALYQQYQTTQEPLNYQSYPPNKTLNQRELAYKPSVAQGWKSQPIYLPTDLYVPKEISLDSYHTPPNTESFIPKPQSINNIPSLRSKNPWIQSNGREANTGQQSQAYFKVSSEPINSPWHEIERKTPKSHLQENWFKPQSQPQPSYNYKPIQQKFETAPQQQYQYPQQNKFQPGQYQSHQPQSKLSNDIYSQNFNTAARGWNGSNMGNCYKPITFGQSPTKLANAGYPNSPAKLAHIQYTDF